MKIVLAAGEAVPFCKTGGLADVVGALSQKLGAAGHDVLLFLPKYREVESAGLQGGLCLPLNIRLGAEPVSVSLRYLQRRAVSVCFVDHPPFFDREGLYGRDGSDHPDNDRRFILFNLAVLEGLKVLGFKPDVIHCHDWQTGLIPALLKRRHAEDPFFAGAASVLTLHNMAYQGNFPPSCLEAAGLSAKDFTPDTLEYYGNASFLKGGIVFADLLTTVSPAYAREIQESGERGFGMEGLLRRRADSLFGVLNGIDVDIWNPEKDAHLARRFSAADRAAGKAVGKAAMQAACGLAQDARKPLVGVISRLDYQKGLDLAIQAIEPRLDRCQFVVVGTGDAELQQEFAALERRHPGVAHFHRAFDEAFARRLYAGCDLFLMPSRFEPCGLGQMIAMRYGSVPVASRTGGLSDTVFESGPRANGFLAAPGDAADLGRALDRALERFGSPAWDDLSRAAIAGDFSWERSINLYLELYRKALQRRASAAR